MRAKDMRTRLIVGVSALLVALSLGAGGSYARPAATVFLPLPATGNASVVRLVLKGSASSVGTPKLAVASRQSLPAGAYVVAGVARGSQAGQFSATVALFNPGKGTSPTEPVASGKLVPVQLPPGFVLGGAPAIAVDVVYANPTPAFKLVAGGAASVLGGSAPKLPAARIVMDAQLLAFDRNVPLADGGLLGMQYVAAQLSRPSPTTLVVTIGLSRLTQVNAVELAFPSGMTVAGFTGPERTDVILKGTAAQLVSSRGFFQEGVSYRFTLRLSRAPKKGEFATLRASEHYFESSLPFKQRLALV